MTQFAAAALKTSLETLLETAAGTLYTVIGTRKRSTDADILSKSRVTIFYDGGNFPKGGGSAEGGPYSHEAAFKIYIASPAKARADIAMLDNPDASEAQRAAAMSAATDATVDADALFDQVSAYIWGVIMAPENRKLGLDYNPRRWVTRIEKNAPLKDGSIAIVDGTLSLSTTIFETPDATTPEPLAAVDGIVTLTADVSGEHLDSAKQGAKVGE